MRIDQVQLLGDRRSAFVALLLLLVPSIWYVRTDLALFAQGSLELNLRLAARLALVVTVAGGIFWVAASRSRKAYSRAALVIAWGVVVSMVALNALRPEGAGLPLRSPLFTLAILYAAIPNSLSRQVTPPLVLTACLIFLRVTRLTAGVESDIPGDIVILLSLNALGVLLVHRRLESSRRLGDAWTAEAAARTTAERAQDELFHLAFRDSVTNAYSRRYFDDALERELLRARRHRTPVSLLLVDVDHFKRINDTYGHKVGDGVLARIANTLQANIRVESITARFGGDEFAILLPECSTGAAMNLAERVRSEIEKLGSDRDESPVPTVTIGIATSEPSQSETADQLVRRADKALYRAKHEGRNRVAAFAALAAAEPPADSVHA